jgi:SPP1 gp7 family putative phage head morphogenesis protein
MRLDRAWDKLKEEIYTGTSRGESVVRLTNRVQKIFRDRPRAQRIARTEASRAVHGGQLFAAKQSGVVKGLKWLAKSDACPVCRGLNGKVVDLGRAFFTNRKATGTYRSVQFPPLHPHCTCTVVEVLK